MRLFLTLPLVALAFATVAACGSSETKSEFDGGTGGDGDATVDGSGGGDGGPTIPTGDGSVVGVGVADAGLDKCADSNAKAALTPLHYVVLVDRSGSMCFKPDGSYFAGCSDPTTRWQQALPAMKTFFEAPASTGTFASLMVFPTDEVCATGAAPLGAEEALPNASGSLTAALTARRADGGNTPTKAAVTKALAYAKQQQAQLNDGGKTVLILVTDGKPEQCNEGANPAAISDDVKAVLANAKATDGTQTYIIGLAFQDADLKANLTTMAAGAGTAPIFVTSPTQVQQELGAALAQIRGQVLSCEYAIPAPPNGKQLDPNKVNVQYDAGDGSPVATLGKSQDCATASGWHYDNATTPTKVILCPDACASAKANTKASVSVVFGCATIDGDPR
jgi:hypothetical protein